MKKILTTVILGVLLLALMVCAPAQGGAVYDRVTFSGATNCVGYWTNTFSYSSVKLVRVCVENALTATNVVTFVRTTSDGLYTQAIGAVTCASGAGVQATLTTSYLKFGDIVTATGIDAATGAASNTYTGMVEFEVQQH